LEGISVGHLVQTTFLMSVERMHGSVGVSSAGMPADPPVMQ